MGNTQPCTKNTTGRDQKCERNDEVEEKEKDEKQKDGTKLRKRDQLLYMLEVSLTFCFLFYKLLLYNQVVLFHNILSSPQHIW